MMVFWEDNVLQTKGAYEYIQQKKCKERAASELGYPVLVRRLSIALGGQGMQMIAINDEDVENILELSIVLHRWVTSNSGR